MALTFPLALPDFANLLRMSSVRMKLVADQQISGLQTGQLIVADLAPKYWEIEVSLINMENADARKIQGLVESLNEGLNDFYWYDPRSEYPIADPDGSILGSSTVVIETLPADYSKIALSGLPAGYVISPGDFLSYDFGSSPEHRAFHRVVDGGTANGSGVSPTLEIRPLRRPGATLGTTVRLIKAAGKFKMIPNSFDPGVARQMMTSGMMFKARQVV